MSNQLRKTTARKIIQIRRSNVTEVVFGNYLSFVQISRAQCRTHISRRCALRRPAAEAFESDCDDLFHRQAVRSGRPGFERGIEIKLESRVQHQVVARHFGNMDLVISFGMYLSKRVFVEEVI